MRPSEPEISEEELRHCEAWSGFASVEEYRRPGGPGRATYVVALERASHLHKLPRDSVQRQAVCDTLDRLYPRRKTFYKWIERLGAEASKRANKRRASGQPSPPRESADQARQYVVDSVAVHEWRALGAMLAYAEGDLGAQMLLRMLRAASTAYAQAKVAGVPSVRVLRQEGST